MVLVAGATGNVGRELVIGLMQTLGALRRSEYAYVTDTVEKIGKVRPRTFEQWCHCHKEAFQ